MPLFICNSTPYRRDVFVIATVLILFAYFSLAGLHGFGETSAFLSLTSRWISPAVIFFCWPDRLWVREKMATIKGEFSPKIGGAPYGWS